MRVLVVGSITRDAIIDMRTGPEVVVRKPGGTSFYATSAYARLGASVSVVSRVAARDEAWVRRGLPAGVDLHVQSSPATTSFENRYDGEERKQRVGPIAPPIDVDDALVRTADWVHLGPLHPADLSPDWYRVVAVPLGLDVQGIVRHVDGDRVVPRAVPDLADRLRTIHWLKAGIDEWQVVLDALDASEAKVVARLGGTEVLRTEGRRGGVVLAADRQPTTWPPSPLVEHRDPTGAGDVFFAAYLFQRAGRGASAGDAALAAARFVSEFLLERSP